MGDERGGRFSAALELESRTPACTCDHQEEVRSPRWLQNACRADQPEPVIPANIAGAMSLGSITNMLGDMPRPTDLGAGNILLQSRGPGELFFGALRKNGLISPYVLHAHSRL